MKKPGFVIADSSKRSGYFTSSSSYDRAQFCPLKEATVYITAELAEQAASKLRKYGSYGATVVPVMELDLASEPTPPAPESEDQMVAKYQGDVCPECDHEPCTCPIEDNSAQDEFDTEDNLVGDDAIDFDGESKYTESSTNDFEDDDFEDLDQYAEDLSKEEYDEYEIEPVVGSSNVGMHTANYVPRMPAGAMRDLDESEKYPSKTIQYKQPSSSFEDESTKLCKVTAHDHQERVSVPTYVTAGLKKLVSDCKKSAELNKNKEYDDASFCLTCANAFQTLLDYLYQGNVEGVKQAQIAMSSFMNPILSKIPDDIKKYLYMGGRKPSLKEMFDDRRSLNEAKNHMGEKEYNTFAGWKAACKKANGEVWFEGDKETCQAHVGEKPFKKGATKGIGEWDGEKGCIYN